MNTIIIKPLKSVFKITKTILIFSFCFLIPLILDLLSSDFSLIILLEFILFMLIFVFNLLKLIKLNKSIYIIDDKDNILINKQIYNLKKLSFKLDKHSNLILFYKQKRIIKINKLSYNIEILKQKLETCDK